MPTVQIYSSTNDGYISNSSGSWAGVHDGTSGTAVSTDSYKSSAAYVGWNSTNSTYYIFRSFFEFNTSSIPANAIIQSVVFKWYGYSSSNGTICFQKSTHSNPLTGTDFDNFTGSYYATATITLNQYNSIPFNAQGIADIVKGGITKICAREYNHDYLNSANTDHVNYGAGCYYADSSTNKPYLEITYIVPGGAFLFNMI